jgi:hypothetical protein
MSAIDYLQELKKSQTGKYAQKWLDEAIDALKQKSEWIPVSEKPKEIGCYMTTIDYGEYGLSVGPRVYYGKDHGWTDVHVIAWMPLPLPYKPQESKEVEL